MAQPTAMDDHQHQSYEQYFASSSASPTTAPTSNEDFDFLSSSSNSLYPGNSMNASGSVSDYDPSLSYLHPQSPPHQLSEHDQASYYHQNYQSQQQQYPMSSGPGHGGMPPTTSPFVEQSAHAVTHTTDLNLNLYSTLTMGQNMNPNGSIMRSDRRTRRGLDIGIGLGDFDVLETLGTGTFGKVLLTRLRPAPGRSVQQHQAHFALKVLEKVTIVRLRQVEHLNSERSTLVAVSHPFIVNLICTFQDERNLYLLMEYVQGGELFSHLRRAGRFSPDVARFYAANLILALEYLHSQDIIYRDLKPENLLIDALGYIKITDFGFAKHVPERTFTLCGTPEYLAPEIITATGHGRAADYWAYGVLLFELLAGYPPFFDDNPLGIYEKILNGKFSFPPHIDFVAKDLIKRLLTADLSKRLGNLKAGTEDIKNHRWFDGVDWEAVKRKEIRAPIIPSTSTPGDTSNFERYPPAPLEDLPGVLRAAQARQYHVEVDSIERSPDPYGYLFPSF